MEQEESEVQQKVEVSQPRHRNVWRTIEQSVFAVAVLGALSMGGCMSINRVVRDYGYQPIKPPSLAIPPGTIVKITNKISGRFGAYELEPICPASEAVPGAVPFTSPSTELTAQQKLSSVNKIKGDYVELINVQVGVDIVREVETKWNNVKILQLDRSSIKKALPNRSQSCKDEVAEALKAGEQLTMVTGVLQADVDYVIKLKVGVPVTVEIAAKIVNGLGLQGDHQNELSQQSTIKGTGIYWGMRELSNKQTANLAPGRTEETNKSALSPEDQIFYDNLLKTALPENVVVPYGTPSASPIATSLPPS